MRVTLAIYYIACITVGITLSLIGIHLNNWGFWVIIIAVIANWIAGREYERIKRKTS